MKILTLAKKTPMEEPLVTDEQQQPTDGLPPKDDVESGAGSQPHFVIVRAHKRRGCSAIEACMFLMAFIVMSLGIFAGLFMYQLFARVPVQRLRGIFNVPYDNSEGRHLYYFDPASQNHQASPFIYRDDYFTEEIEADDFIERIDVPDFRGGRRGRFIHDFVVNKTGIVDLEGKRCFVMPLNRNHVLPPNSLLDLLRKTKEGYYDVDTEVLRETMRVELPPISGSDMDTLGNHIARECNGKKTYALVKVNSPVFKRSADTPAVVFAVFAGKGTMELDLLNYNEVLAYEGQGA